ncbi:MAG: UbiA family prenyltransferase, partial [Gammaproteobacteria bacterium]|nr:UbiA family prenyltransferase [Gammaproteobacteria bacterium]
LKGKACLKHAIAQRVVVEYSLLPYNADVINYIKKQKNAGRQVILVTASDIKLAHGIADYLGMFDKVFASDSRINLKGRMKAEKLVAEYGERGFTYIGNDEADLHIWKHADLAVVTGSNKTLKNKIDRGTPVELIECESEYSVPELFIRATRPHQWVKNVLIFIPLLLAHEYTDLTRVLSTFQAFVSFCLCASAVYIFNDLMDLDSDRIHPTKKYRPFASGDLSLLTGMIFSPVLLIISLALAIHLSVDYVLVFSVYFISTTAYSLGLKTIALLDVFILAGLYTIRVLAGTVAANVELSFWLLAFSLFLFFSLALLKRYSELFNLAKRDKESTTGRGYLTEDKNLLAALGIASGYISVLVMALYLQTPEHIEHYRHPELLWMVFPALLYWVSRIWLLAHRGFVNEDPVLFAVKDPQSYVIVVIAILGIFLAL